MKGLTKEQTHKLLKLLQRKLAGIPSGHLPTLTLGDIVDQTPKALSLPNIPPDLQLPFFLANRDLIHASIGLAIQDFIIQPLNITRAIFYYRLDEVHHFQRFHDVHRWNVAIFLALLTVPEPTSDINETDKVYFPPAARRFVIMYLEAVLEHHNTPTVFRAREAFIQRWKESRFGFFTFNAGQKKVLKTCMKQLTVAWDVELDRVHAQLGPREYQIWIARFVGVLIPGRMERRLQQVGSQVADPKPSDLPEGTLLAALRTELGPGGYLDATDVNRWAETLSRPRQAISILKCTEPRTILQHLMHTLPPELKYPERDLAIGA